MYPNSFECSCKQFLNASHFSFNMQHDMVNFNNTISISTSILQFRVNPTIFTKVKARTEGQMNRQTERRVEIIFFGCVENVKKKKTA